MYRIDDNAIRRESRGMLVGMVIAIPWALIAGGLLAVMWGRMASSASSGTQDLQIISLLGFLAQLVLPVVLVAFVGRLLAVNMRVAVTTSVVVMAMAAFPALILLSWVNSCSIDSAFPFPGYGDCGD